MSTEWRSIKIPNILYEEIMIFIKEKSRLGYTSVPDFIVEAGRQKLMKETAHVKEYMND